MMQGLYAIVDVTTLARRGMPVVDVAGLSRAPVQQRFSFEPRTSRRARSWACCAPFTRYAAKKGFPFSRTIGRI